MRLFTAVFPSPGTGKFLLRLMESFPKGLPVRWLSGSNHHLTLNFLEDVETGRIATLAGVVKRALKEQKRFELVSDGLGLFPETTEPRIVYLGFKGEINKLRQMQRRLETTLLSAGFLPKTGRVFVPHLTLGRIPKPLAGKEVRRLRRRLHRLEMVKREHRFAVEEIVLVRSRLKRSGPEYEVVERFRLA